MMDFAVWPRDAGAASLRAVSREQVLRGFGAERSAHADPWRPSTSIAASTKADYIVDSEALENRPPSFRTLQAAVDQALRDDSKTPSGVRRVIRLSPGFFEGPVYLPAGGPPLSIFGAGPGKTILAARIDAQMPGAEYEERFGTKFFGSVPAILAQFASIAARERITTGNSAVLRIARDDTIVAGLTIRNDYACDRREAAPRGAEPDAEGRYSQGQHQAVACHVARADRVRLHALNLESYQDTLYLEAPALWIGRSYVTGCRITGDVDFIFGGATAIFEQCEIQSRGMRGARSWAVAPSTKLNMPHGFVFDDCRFTHDGSETGREGGCFLGRQWFEGVRATPYAVPPAAGYQSVPGDADLYGEPVGQISRGCLEAVGKCTVQNSVIGRHISPAAPWDDWAAGGWSPRYRPVQWSARDFLGLLDRWLRVHKLDYSGLDAGDNWLQIVNCRWDDC